jgi:hypothetical protein
VPAAPGAGPDDVDRSDRAGRAWSDRAVAAVEADARRSADTHLLVYPLPPEWGVELYLKDESTHPTGSLKHRLARSLFLYGLCSGQITEGSTVVEASSGSTAVSEAYFARTLGLPFVAVMPATTSPEKVTLIEFHGGRCHFVERAPDIYDEARRLAAECGGHQPDQFSNAERATDWRGNNNIAESIFSQLALERHPLPEWVVVGARRAARARRSAATCGTGGCPPGWPWPTRRDRRSFRLAGPRPRDGDRAVLPHRGHRPAAGGAVVRADDRRPDDPRPRRRLPGRDADASSPLAAAQPPSPPPVGHDLWSAYELNVDAEVVGPGLPEPVGGVSGAGQAARQRQADTVGQAQARAVAVVRRRPGGHPGARRSSR